MRLYLLAVGIAVLGLAATAGAQTIPVLDWAAPRQELQPTASWYGSTGLVRTPTAMISPTLRVTAGAHRIEMDDVRQDLVTANVAVLPDLELGVTHVGNMRARGVMDAEWKDEVIFNAKYRINMGSLVGLRAVPQVAVGVWDAADRFDRTLYVALSQNFPFDGFGALSSLNAHVGYGRSEHRTGALDGMFFGVDFSPFRRAVLQVEYDAQDFNAAMRYYVTEWLALDLGVVDGDLGWGLSARAGF